jgi:hypothetical protein
MAKSRRERMDDVARLCEHMFEQRPQSDALPSVRVGTFVKIGIRGERFWCCVKSTRGDGALLGVVDNDLLKSPWRRGEEIVLQRNHVLETAEPTDELTFRNLVTRFGSVGTAAAVWQDLRRMERAAAKPKPGTVFVLPDISWGYSV